MSSAVVAVVNDLSSIAAAWILTFVALAAYVGYLLARGRRARLRAEAVAARRDRSPRAGTSGS